jgi:hypothetical protein
MDDRPGRHEQQGRGAVAEDLVVQLDPALVDVARGVRFPRPHGLSPPSIGCREDLIVADPGVLEEVLLVSGDHGLFLGRVVSLARAAVMRSRP